MAEIAKHLKTHGFARKGRVFNRKLGELTHVVEVELRPWTPADQRDMSVSCGIYIGNFSTWHGWMEPDFPGIPDCGVKANAFTLTGSPLRWVFGANGSLVGTDIVAFVEGQVIPFISRFMNIDSLVEWLGRGDYASTFEPNSRSNGFALQGTIESLLGNEKRAEALFTSAATAAETQRAKEHVLQTWRRHIARLEKG